MRRLEPDDRVAALDPGRCKSPGAGCYPVLVQSESIGVAEVFVDLPHQRIIGRRHVEGDTASFSPSQRYMSVKMLDDDGNVVCVAAHELSAQIDISH
jgi:hypothetical protein